MSRCVGAGWELLVGWDMVGWNSNRGRDGWDVWGCGWDWTRGWEGWGRPQ